jgi:phage terminase large subunit-like protein
MNWVREYWNQITSGDVLVSVEVYQQMALLIDDLDHPKSISYENELGETITEEYVFDEELGQRKIDFIEMFCKHSKAPWTGKPVILELWQKARIQAAFGFIDKNTGLRQYNEVITAIGRKNGKTTEGAAIGIDGLVADGEGGAEVYSVATKKDIARKSFGEACNMVSQDEDLSSMISKRKSDLYHDASFSEFKPLASDADTLDGLNASRILADEIHAWKTRALYDVMIQSVGARDQPMMWIMTTLGFIRESICDELIDYAQNVLNGTYPRDFKKLFFIYKLDSRDEWTNPKMWIKANPGLGTIKKFKYLHDMVESAKMKPNLLPTVLTKDFNIIETTAGSWLTFETILNKETFDIEMFRGFYCVSGTDLSSVGDLTCASLIFIHPDKFKLRQKVDPETGEIIEGEFEKVYYKYLIQQYFIPEEILKKKVEEDKVPYDKWRDQGWVTAIPGSRVDPKHITAWFVTMFNRYDMRPLWNGCDPWGTNSWVPEMEGYGFEMEIVVQGAKTMSNPAKLMAADLADNMLIYNNNPIFKWCLTNTSMKSDENENIRPIKKDKQRLRIDGTVSAINAYVTLDRHFQDYINMIEQ